MRLAGRYEDSWGKSVNVHHFDEKNADWLAVDAALDPFDDYAVTDTCDGETERTGMRYLIEPGHAKLETPIRADSVRYCEEDWCGARLSNYNVSRRCWLHGHRWSDMRPKDLIPQLLKVFLTDGDI